MLAVAGAVAMETIDPSSPDAGVAAHYGDPMREQRTLATEVGLVDRSNRGVVAVAGVDRLGWLHSITTQHLTALLPRTGTELLVLTPHGHVEQHAVVLDDGRTTWLDVEPGTAGALLGFLQRMRFLMRVEPADVTDGWALLSLVGPGSLEVVASLSGPGGAGSAVAPGPDSDAVLAEPELAPVPGPKFPAGTVRPRPTSRYAVTELTLGGYARRMSHGVDLLVPRTAVTEVVAAAGVPLAGLWAFEALRVARRQPRHGRETDHRTLPAEVGWLAAAVHLDKGCYRGQETVARVHNLGRPPRKLVLLHLDGMATEELPAAGTPVCLAEGKVVGFLGTAARHYELGPVALAVVRQNLPVPTTLRVGAGVAAVDPDTPDLDTVDTDTVDPAQ